MPQPIAILCHWRTGSTLLQDTLAACGMVDCLKEYGLEKKHIDHAGADLYHGGKSVEESVAIVRHALREYRRLAEADGHEFYGLKVNHVLQAKCWEHMGPIFKEEWPDAKYVISVRDPAGIVNSIHKMRRRRKLNPEMTDEDIMASWESSKDAAAELICDFNAELVEFPYAYESKTIIGVAERLGLSWNENSNIFDGTKVGGE